MAIKTTRGNSILLFFLILFTGISGRLLAQEYTISGTVTDDRTGERKAGATLMIHQQEAEYFTDTTGFYSLKVSGGPVWMSAGYEGYITAYFQFRIRKDTTINIRLQKEIFLDEIEVTANSIESNMARTQMSTFAIPTGNVLTLPSFLGETDIIRSTQLATGVQSGNEGSMGFFVRGGSAGQNLILMDGIPLYTINHMLGIYSVFNTDAIRSANLYKGGFPARYGGRLSSVLDIGLKEGNMTQYHGNVSLGLIFSKINLEGPILKDKISFHISARRTYADLIYKAIQKPANLPANNGDLFFYDYNAKLTVKMSENSRLTLGAFKGVDETAMRLSDRFVHKNVLYTEINNLSMNWNNFTAYLKWNKTYSNRLIGNMMLAYNNYLFDLNYDYYLEKENSGKANTFEFAYGSGIKDLLFNLNYSYVPSENHYVTFGMNLTNQCYNPDTDLPESAEEENRGGNSVFKLEGRIQKGYLYLEDDIRISEKLNTSVGAHLSGLVVDGRFYSGLEPRLSLRYLFSDRISFKSSYTRMNQYLHLLSTATISSPVDLWVPVTKKVKPEKSSQVALGLTYGLSETYEVNLETYYKKLKGVIAYKDGETFTGSTLGWEDKIEAGEGTSYGAELLFRKTKGKTYGWIGYTLSWSNRQFENINYGKVFPYRYDRRHDLNVVVMHDFSDRIQAGFTWIFGTGNAASLSAHQFMAKSFPHTPDDEGIVKYFHERNSYRMPAYHRLDLSVNFYKKKKYGTRTWKIGLYNAYNHQNPFFLFFGYDDSREVASTGPDGEVVYSSPKVLKQFSLLPVLPAVSYSYRF